MSNIRGFSKQGKPIDSLAQRVTSKARDWKKLGKGAISTPAQEAALNALEKAAWRRNQPKG